MKFVTQAILKQRHIVKFLFKEDNKPLNVSRRFENIYGDRAMKKTEVYFWIAEARRGREDLFDEERPRRPFDIGLDEGWCTGLKQLRA
jgi:hypothetical protein